MSKIVVSDTTAITNLNAIDALYILFALFDEIIIAQEVYEELCRMERNKVIFEHHKFSIKK